MLLLAKPSGSLLLASENYLHATPGKRKKVRNLKSSWSLKETEDQDGDSKRLVRVGYQFISQI